MQRMQGGLPQTDAPWQGSEHRQSSRRAGRRVIAGSSLIDRALDRRSAKLYWVVLCCGVLSRQMGLKTAHRHADRCVVIHVCIVAYRDGGEVVGIIAILA